MNKKLIFWSVALICFCHSGLAQSGMVQKSGGGSYFNAEQHKIDQLKLKTNKPPSSDTKYDEPKDYSKPKSGTNSSGEIWIDGYCRYRPASSNEKRFCSDQTEIKYHTAVYPTDTIRYWDNFSGQGNIAWDEANGKNYPEKTGYKHVADSLNDGIPLTFFEHLWKETDFFDCTEPGGQYEFNRSWTYWVKRIAGPKNMPLEFSSEYRFPNGDDNTVFEIDDNGRYSVKASCFNCKETRFRSKSGKAASWNEGGWNEVTIWKDALNSVKIYVNNVLIDQYQIPNMPITTRYSRCRVKLPYQWQKKNLMYHVGQISVESYPVTKI